MADNETPTPSVTPEGQPEAPAPTSTPPLTIEAMKEALLPEIRKELKSAYDAARRAEAKAERAPQADIERLTPIQQAVEELLTRDLSDDAKEAFKAKRDLARVTRPDPAADHDREITVFQQEVSSILEEEGIPANHPVLSQAWDKHSQSAKTPAQWRTAFGRAVAEVRKDEAKKAGASVADEVKKAREDERTKVLNEHREKEGPIDRAQPASSNGKTDYLAMTDEEFKRVEAAKDAERKARRLRAG